MCSMSSLLRILRRFLKYPPDGLPQKCSHTNRRNGDTYAREYFGDKIHGFGVYHFGSGYCFEGLWHEGRKQGDGMYTFRNGELKCGERDCGFLKTHLPQLTDSVL